MKRFSITFIISAILFLLIIHLLVSCTNPYIKEGDSADCESAKEFDYRLYETRQYSPLIDYVRVRGYVAYKGRGDGMVGLVVLTGIEHDEYVKNKVAIIFNREPAIIKGDKVDLCGLILPDGAGVLVK
jgi:hypothetical protein